MTQSAPTASSLLQSYTQVYGPRFYLEANGTLAQDLMPYIFHFEYEDHDTKTDVLKLKVLNPGLMWKDDPRFQEGASWACRFGYLTDISDIKNIVISKAKPHFPQSGIPTIEMVAFNLQQPLNKKANPKNWGVCQSSDIAGQIAMRYGFTTDIESSNDSRSQHRIQTAGVSDIQYLIGLAAKLNWDCYIEGTVLHFHHKRFESPATLSFQYFTDGTGTLLKFEPEVNMNAAATTGAAGTSTQTGTGAAVAGNSAPPAGRAYNFDQQTLAVGPVHAVDGESGITHPSPESDPRVIGIHGAAIAQKVDMHAAKAHCEIIGTPRFRARTMVAITGVDHYYTGNWRIKGSKHVITTSGYKVTGELVRDSGAAKGKSENQTGGTAPTPVPMVQGYDVNKQSLFGAG
jgi:phage protein D